MTNSYNNAVTGSASPRLDNLLTALSLGLADDGNAALARATGLSLSLIHI